MHKRLICTVHGQVHGVLYRDTTARRAQALGLTGFVQNESDGTVRVVAEGEEATLQEFLSAIRKGSSFSKVTSVEENWNEATGEFADFRIRYSNFFDRF